MDGGLSQRELMVRYAEEFIGVPYRWGGDDPMAGFDCSGLAIEVLKAVGILPLDGDWTANDLKEKFKYNQVSHPYRGCLAFWVTGAGRAYHVEICVDTLHSVGASGGHRTTRDKQAAINENAYIKIRPISQRKGNKFYVDPLLGLSP